ncbi:MAG TPA: hypothetical protein VGE11_16720 [Pseudonocardia sp.]
MPVAGTTTNASQTASSADGSSAAPASTVTSATATGTLTGDGLCALVSPAQAQEALAVSPSVSDQEPGTFVNGEPECGFASDDNRTVIVNVVVFDGAKNPFNSGKFEMADGAPSAVTVAGHQAAVSSTELDIADGDKVLTIENFGSANASSDGLIALGKLFLAKL